MAMHREAMAANATVKQGEEGPVNEFKCYVGESKMDA